MFWKLLTGAALTACLAQGATAQMLVMGHGAAKDCYNSVKHGDSGRRTTIRNCEAALDDVSLRRKDRAATHINVGILYMRNKSYDKASKHYDKALKMSPDVPEVHINLSANYIYTGRYDEAIAAVNTAIGLGTDRMPEALFNRAMAYDHQERFDAAYRDLKKALEYRPDWQPALNALDNYEVVPNPNKAQG